MNLYNVSVECLMLSQYFTTIFPANICLFKVSNKNYRKRYEICSKLTTETPEQRHWRRSVVFIVNFEHISHLFLVFLLLIWNKKMLAGLHVEKILEIILSLNQSFLDNLRCFVLPLTVFQELLRKSFNFVEMCLN